jgi:hypothetical protein
MSLQLAAPSILMGALLSIALPVEAQFSSGSTGADGALDYSSQPPGTTIVFTPSTFGHKASQPVYNFTTINIPTGVTVRLSGTLIAGPVIWLATGTVQIAGIVDLSGGAGGCESPTECRTPSVPGAGGYPGGVGGGSTANPPEPGLGPGGGAAGTAASPQGQGGAFTGNSLLVPLVGGSGGGGEWSSGGGGAGGGAILIASSVSINLTGSIYAYGGDGSNLGDGGGGGGGAIRLAAPTISGNGILYLAGGNCTDNGTNSTHGTPGIARVESFNGASFNINNPGGYCAGAYGVQYLAAPYNSFVSPQAPSTVTITTVNGVPVTEPPTGSFQTPDVTINSSGSVALAIQATNVPVGSIVNLQFYSDNANDLFVQSTPLAGTLAQSTATANVTFPTGYTRGLVFASFTGPSPNIREQAASEVPLRK